MKINRNKKGFTLIEVVLVLAIGGLIFLLAFLAFQQVSRNRRDTQRRADASRILAELQNYVSDNSGALPTASAPVSSANLCSGGTAPAAGSFHAFIRAYMCSGGSFLAPNGSNYEIIVANTGFVLNKPGLESTDNTIVYAPGVACTNDAAGWAASAGSALVAVSLESTAYACRDSR